MQCPACGESLREARTTGLVIDVCRGCGGSFFDRGEFKETLDRMLTSGEVPDAPLELTGRRPVSSRTLREGTRTCPRCGVPMSKFNYCYDSDIMLDRCPQCEGIWADRDEAFKCAQYRKGNPKLDRMGSSMAENVRHRRVFEDACCYGDAITTPHFWLFGGLSLVPVRDDQPSERMPVVTIGLIAANAVVFVLLLAAFGYDGEGIERVFGSYGTVPADIAHGRRIWTLFTSMFLHVNVMHLIGNMLFLWIFGDNVEDRFGRWRFLGFYLIFGVVADLIFVAFNPNSTVPLVGASGAISGVMGAYLVFYPQASIHTIIWYQIRSIPAWAYLGIWIALQVAFAVLSSAAGSAGGVAWLAHIGGFVPGACIAFIWKRRPVPLPVRPTREDSRSS